MKRYRINEIFYSLQGEGRNTGRAAVFVRFSGCNLACSFCDTDFRAYREMTADEVVNTVKGILPSFVDNRSGEGVGTARSSVLVVLTGGEPTLQVDFDLIDALHHAGFPEVAMESNGTKEPPPNLDWLTVSPKEQVSVNRCNELKCLFDESGRADDCGIRADFYYLQPCDTGDPVRNAEIIAACTKYIKQHPKWQLSLQTHKLIGFK